MVALVVGTYSVLVKLNIFKMYKVPNKETWDYYYAWSFCNQMMRMTETTAKVIFPMSSVTLTWPE